MGVLRWLHRTRPEYQAEDGNKMWSGAEEVEECDEPDSR
jgi:hypothetical protein